ncbi:MULTISPECIES: hypothetical protein [Haloferax]|uniref:Integral membrane protein n=2 Tax=Haloferax TaxID=2251 RepID=A0A6G1Z446_9EURY|nr:MULTISPECIES: hypothetical protein [Haloferax]KAB1188392.1 hypothetical protein Hfx1149_10270 [Haloferax sp. CBA1149]MRW81084.1 hypothetical protein [Haloferax marinisediminis]
MRDWPLSRVAGISALVFVVILAALTALRTWNLSPPTPVQSLVIDGGAVLIGAAVAVFVYRGGSVVAGVVLALGPSLAFTFNLFVPVAAPESAAWVVYPLASGVGIALLLGGVGGTVGYVVRRAREEQRTAETS